MRCLTLAEALVGHGAAVSFVCREQPGDASETIRERGFSVLTLAAQGTSGAAPDEAGGNTSLGVTWQTDAAETLRAIEAGGRADWLLVDHYGIDGRWERAVAGMAGRIMVIDDLADRRHDCDLLLDQNYDNPRHALHAALIPPHGRLLLGTRYALVRKEFAEYRPQALARRGGQMRRVLVSMGGTDPRNDTARALAGLAMRDRGGLKIDVVIGRGNPHQREVRARCEQIPGARLHVQSSRMAELMGSADFSIAAGGSTTWERCVLGLPALVVIRSPDQCAIAQALGTLGAHRVLGEAAGLRAQDYDSALATLSSEELLRMASVAAGVCDGQGAERVAAELTHWKDIHA